MKETVPKKSLGQHWLYDDVTLEAICDAADVQPGDDVLEVGPGLGTLTRKLLQRGAHVTAVEFDTNLAQTLTDRLWEDSPPKREGGGNITVVEGIFYGLTYNSYQGASKLLPISHTI
ncbi:class I SAM-dependent methyltransferase [Candidatus Saccharibacteria bacterium]|nr:MAG: class I SAM-dependent methyltransferase [Candidatus Saccharibacteria bacterium]